MTDVLISLDSLVLVSLLYMHKVLRRAADLRKWLQVLLLVELHSYCFRGTQQQALFRQEMDPYSMILDQMMFPTSKWSWRGQSPSSRRGSAIPAWALQFTRLHFSFSDTTDNSQSAGSDRTLGAMVKDCMCCGWVLDASKDLQYTRSNF